MAYVNAVCAGRVTIFSTGGEFRLGSNLIYDRDKMSDQGSETSMIDTKMSDQGWDLYDRD